MAQLCNIYPAEAPIFVLHDTVVLAHSKPLFAPMCAGLYWCIVDMTDDLADVILQWENYPHVS